MMTSRTSTIIFTVLLTCGFAAQAKEGVDFMAAVEAEFDQTFEGCCRHRNENNKLESPQSTSYPFNIFASLEEATFDCLGRCDAVSCSAIEVTRKQRNKYSCELHTALINAATRATKSCKKSKCYAKSVLPPVAPAPAPAPSQKDAKTDVVVPFSRAAEDFDETMLPGCCREKTADGKLVNHADNSVTTFTYDKAGLTVEEGENKCRHECIKDTNCAAAEFSRGRKKNGLWKCELHSNFVNQATRASRSCKTAKCYLFWL